jgi:uncharacterized RDD family membrane protein YckC
MEYGGFWIRLVAYIIDSIIVTVLFFILVFVLSMVGIVDYSWMAEFDAAVQADVEPDPAVFMAMMQAMGIIYLLGFLVAWLYEALLTSSAMQATPGKMVFGLRVTALDGQQIGFGRATGRFFGKIVSGVILYVGFIMIAFTERKQGLHDMMASTLVVRG